MTNTPITEMVVNSLITSHVDGAKEKLGTVQRNAVHDIVVVTGGIVDQVRGLGLADDVGGSGLKVMLALDLQGKAPAAESVAAKIRP